MSFCGCSNYTPAPPIVGEWDGVTVILDNGADIRSLVDEDGDAVLSEDKTFTIHVNDDDISGTWEQIEISEDDNDVTTE
ncbi:MAG: hypothetical protein ACI4TK_03420 [Agathobacter sp.]